MACGAKVPRVPQTEKKKNKNKGKKKSKIKTAIAMIALLMIVVFPLSFFGDEIVPEKVRDLKAYSWLTATVKDKLPDEIKLPFGLKVELPLDLPDFAFQLPFDLDERFSGLTERLSGLPLLGFLSDDGGDSIDVAENSANKSKADAESAKAVERSEEEKEFIAAGADNSIVLSSYNIFADIPTDWIRSNVKILKHRTDIDAGTDTVVIYLELENRYVSMIGTKEITYLYNEETGDWEAGPASKISCLHVEPVTAQL